LAVRRIVDPVQQLPEEQVGSAEPEGLADIAMAMACTPLKDLVPVSMYVRQGLILKADADSGAILSLVAYGPAWKFCCLALSRKIHLVLRNVSS
jgi:hypothetical protein